MTQQDPIWKPTDQTVQRARITQYMDWLRRELGLHFDDYPSLWQWSVDNLDQFWSSIWDFFEIKSSTRYEQVLANDKMPGACWFPGATLNVVEQIFSHTRAEYPAIKFAGENTRLTEMSWAELAFQVAALAETLTELGVKPGDRVAAYLPNIPETTVAFLATASIGAVWSVCAPDLGIDGVLDRFGQIEPKILIGVEGYQYAGKYYERAESVARLAENLPSVTAVILVPGTGDGSNSEISSRSLGRKTLIAWVDAMVGHHASFAPTQVPFDHPLWIVYSSGTTGAPKAIVHGHGGVMLEASKASALHFDLGPGDCFHWSSSTAWIMWNMQVTALLVGTTIFIYDGHPGYPSSNVLWELADQAGVTFFGAGAAYFDACRQKGLVPGKIAPLERLRAIGSTGSPLQPEAYRWVYDSISRDVFLVSVSGGTDIAGGFVSGVPILPVYEGEIQCRCLGSAVAAFDDDGKSVVDQVGELVCTKPMPSMPLYFWGDHDDTRYRDSYFATYPGVWQQGDWVRITKNGGAIIYGRSDATINRHGIRMGTSELYRVVEELPAVLDSLIVDLEYLGREPYLLLFIVPGSGASLDESLRLEIENRIRTKLSPRHIPDDVFSVDEIPRTASGKKMEIPIRRLLLGQPSEDVINKDTMDNPASIGFFEHLARKLNK